MPLMNGRQNLLDRYVRISLSDLLSKLLDVLDRRVDLLLPALGLRNQPGDAPAMARDHDSRAPLDRVEQLRQMGLGLRRLHFARPLTGIIGPKGGGIFAETPAASLHCRFLDRLVDSTGHIAFHRTKVKRVEPRRPAGA